MVRYELKKVFSKPGSIIALALLVLLLLVNVWAAVDVTYVNEAGESEHGYAAAQKLRAMQKEWAGVLDEEKLRAVIEENQRILAMPGAMSDDYILQNKVYHHKQGFQEICYLLSISFAEGFQLYDFSISDRLTVEDADEFYTNRISLLTEWLYGDYKDYFSEEEKQFLIGQYEALETPFYFDYMRGWTSLANYSPTICMLTMMVLGYLLAGIFANEFKWKSDAIFFSAKYGRNRAVGAKIKAGIIIITVTYWVMMVLFTVLILGFRGADGANCLVQADASGWKCFYHITNIQRYWLSALGGYLGCLFIGGLVMYVSAKSNSAVLAVIVPFAAIFVPSFLGGLNLQRMDKILALLPDRLLQVDYALEYFDLIEIGGQVMGAVPVLFALYAVLTIVLIPAVYFVYRRNQIT